jgi:hypothetical protein
VGRLPTRSSRIPTGARTSAGPTSIAGCALAQAELRPLDDALGHLFEALREQGLLEREVLVATFDHGEAFGERGQVTDGRTFHPEVYAVPLLVRAAVWAMGSIPAGTSWYAPTRAWSASIFGSATAAARARIAMERARPTTLLMTPPVCERAEGADVLPKKSLQVVAVEHDRVGAGEIVASAR